VNISSRIITALVMSAMVVAAGCESEKTIRVKRGASMLGLEGEIGQETLLADGTRVVVVDELPSARSKKKDDVILGAVEPPPFYTAPPYSLPGVSPPPPPKPQPPKELKLREVTPDGKIILRAVMPEHVMAHLVEAVRTREYAPFYAQMLSKEAHDAYQRAGGEAVFVEWAEKNRKDLLTFLNRMGSNWNGSEVITERVTALRMRYRLDRRNLPDIRFEIVEIVNQGGAVRLAMIR